VLQAIASPAIRSPQPQPGPTSVNAPALPRHLLRDERWGLSHIDHHLQDIQYRLDGLRGYRRCVLPCVVRRPPAPSVELAPARVVCCTDQSGGHGELVGNACGVVFRGSGRVREGFVLPASDRVEEAGAVSQLVIAPDQRRMLCSASGFEVDGTLLASTEPSWRPPRTR